MCPLLPQPRHTARLNLHCDAQYIRLHLRHGVRGCRTHCCLMARSWGVRCEGANDGWTAEGVVPDGWTNDGSQWVVVIRVDIGIAEQLPAGVPCDVPVRAGMQNGRSWGLTVCTSVMRRCCNSLTCVSADSVAWATLKAFCNVRLDSANSMPCVLWSLIQQTISSHNMSLSVSPKLQCSDNLFSCNSGTQHKPVVHSSHDPEIPKE